MHTFLMYINHLVVKNKQTKKKQLFLSLPSKAFFRSLTI